MLPLVASIVMWSGTAWADVGPSCGCEVGSRTEMGRGALAATFGLLGLGVLFFERQRRSRARR
jgi:hypothetical protein